MTTEDCYEAVCNDFEGAMEGIEEHDFLDLSKCLSDAGKYAYAGLCAITLHELFNTNWDLDFCNKSLSIVLQHLNLPSQVEPIMELLLSGEIINSPESFISVLLEEEAIDGNLKILIQDLISIAVQEGEYDARWRVLIRHLAEMLGAKFEEMELYEIAIVHSLTSEGKEPTDEEKKIMKHKQRIVKAKRYALISLATIGGGTLIGLTGGLAAPLIGGGLGALLGTSATIGALSTAAGAAVVGTLFGAAGASLAGYKMKKRVGEIEEFAFGQLYGGIIESKEGYKMKKRVGEIEEFAFGQLYSGIIESKEGVCTVVTTPQLDITIAISGWIKDESENNFTFPWRCLCISREQYYLRYESEYLLELGRALEYFVTMALSMATQEVLKYTILSTLVTAISLPAGLLGLASVIDNPWGVCCRRSAQVGKQLAEVLLAREHGRRPVTLIGYSLGARVIYYCLREMSERKGCEGVVQDAYLIGGPCSANPNRWLNFTRVVAGTITNAYCKSDWLLKFLYRTLSFPVAGVSGLQPIELNHKRLRNIDLSHIISGHSEYPEKISLVLKELGIRIIEEDDNLTGITKSQTSEVFTSDTQLEKPLRISMSEPALKENIIEAEEAGGDNIPSLIKHEGSSETLIVREQGKTMLDILSDRNEVINSCFPTVSLKSGDNTFINKEISIKTDSDLNKLADEFQNQKISDKANSSLNVDRNHFNSLLPDPSLEKQNTEIELNQEFKLIKPTESHPLTHESDSDGDELSPKPTVRRFKPS